MGEPISWRTDLEIDPVIEAYKQHVDRSLIRENLRRSVEERFQRFIELRGFAVELRRAGRAGDRHVKRAAGRPKDLEAIAEFEAIREGQRRSQASRARFASTMER